MKLRIALIQLPIPDSDPDADRGNVSLAAGYLKAYAAASGAVDPDDVSIMPSRTARHAGDAALMDWIRSTGAGMVGFSAYAWNIQRVLELAERTKKEDPSISILLGGPEIADGQPVLSNPVVDSFILGEGEEAFRIAAAQRRAGKRLDRIIRGTVIPDLAAIPNPYIAGAMDDEPGDPLYLETMRGCPHACAYCYYGKSFPRLRRFPPERLSTAFEYARKAAAPEIYIMDPAFDAMPGWDDTLREIAFLNRTGIPLHTEIRLESVTPEKAKLLRAAGFRSVEVGLQSVNPRALAAVGRSWKRKAFEYGAASLLAEGITVKTGIILGLPGDRPSDFEATVDFTAANGLGADMEIYPLSILPGTRLREEADGLGLRFMGFPPYYVLSTPTMSETDMTECLRAVERRLDIDLFPPIMPDFTSGRSEYPGFFDLRAEKGFAESAAFSRRCANRVTILMNGGQLRQHSRIEELGRTLLANNPHTLFAIVVASDDGLDGTAMDRIAEAFYNPGHYFNLLHCFHDDPQGRFSVRLFRLASRWETAEKARLDEEPWECILRSTPGLFSRGKSVLQEKPPILFEGEPEGAAWEEISALYRGHGGLLLRSAGSGLTYPASNTVRE